MCHFLVWFQSYFPFAYYECVCFGCESSTSAALCFVLFVLAKHCTCVLYSEGHFAQVHLKVVCHVASERVPFTGTVLHAGGCAVIDSASEQRISSELKRTKNDSPNMVTPRHSVQNQTKSPTMISIVAYDLPSLLNGALHDDRMGLWHRNH